MVFQDFFFQRSNLLITGLDDQIFLFSLGSVLINLQLYFLKENLSFSNLSLVPLDFLLLDFHICYGSIKFLDVLLSFLKNNLHSLFLRFMQCNLFFESFNFNIIGVNLLYQEVLFSCLFLKPLRETLGEPIKLAFFTWIHFMIFLEFSTHFRYLHLEGFDLDLIVPLNIVIVLIGRGETSVDVLLLVLFLPGDS